MYNVILSLHNPMNPSHLKTISFISFLNTENTIAPFTILVKLYIHSNVNFRIAASIFTAFTY